MSATISSDALAEAFRAARAGGRAALIPYVTAGHPTRAETLPILRMLAEEGADVIELGVPFSDPLADGPVIQRSSFEAIAGGADLAWTMETLAAFRRESGVPVVLFTYLNPMLRYGLPRFLDDAAAAGAQGVLVTDLPLGADPALEDEIERSRLELIRLIAPTSTPERARRIAESARGFLYYVSRAGVTGASRTLPPALAEEVARVRAVASVPVAVGFGISSPEQARAVAALADGVVVGSALVQTLGDGGLDAGRTLVRALRQATLRTG